MSREEGLNPARGRRIRSLFLVLTAGCNLSCSYCYQNRHRGRSMRWGTMHTALEALLRGPELETEVVFFGGEPLLELPLIRRGVAWIEEHTPPGKRVGLSIITNGTLLHRDTLDYLVEHDVAVQLSFDGVPAAQDLRGRGTFRALDALLGRLREEHPDFLRSRVRISVTVVPGNVAHLPDSVAYFLRSGVAAISLSPTITDSSDWDRERLPELRRILARVFRLGLEHHARTGVFPIGGCGEILDDDPHAPEGRSLCGVARGEVPVVDVDGSVYACATFPASFQEYGSEFLRTRLRSMGMGRVGPGGSELSAKGLEERARAAEIFVDKHEKYSAYGRCGECPHLDECTVCPVSIGNIPGNRDPHRVPDFLCAYNLAFLDELPALHRALRSDAENLLFDRDPDAYRRLKSLVRSRQEQGA